MSSDLSERYNEGIVPLPALSADIPSLRPPTNQPTPEQVAQARTRLTAAIVALVAISLVCLASLVCAVYALVTQWPQ